jgi:site-specific recombinase XerD
MKTTQRFSVLIWADKRKADAAGLAPLYARITYLGKRAEISLKRRVHLAKWDCQTGFLKGTSPDARRINADINDTLDEIDKAFKFLKRTDEFITAEKIKLQYLGEEPDRKILLEVFDQHNAYLAKLVGKDFVKATLTKYNTVRSRVSGFIKQKFQKDDVYLDQIDYSFVSDFEMYLKTECGIEHNTSMRYIKNLKKIINLAVHNKWLIHNPFDAFKCTYRKVNRDVLEWEEIELLASHEFKVKRLDEVRDTFLFCCFTGYAFVDVEKLTPQNIVSGKDNVLWIKTTRTKTEIDSNVPLMPQAIEILDKYKYHPCRETENRLLPVKSNQKMNAYLKEIADLAGIKKNLTTHIARHTFATTVTLDNDVPLETVSKMLGHTKFSTTQIYARTKDRKVSRDMTALKNRLKQQKALAERKLP